VCEPSAKSANDWLCVKPGQRYSTCPSAGKYAAVYSVPNPFENAVLYKGADLGILVARCRMQTDDNELTEHCRSWISGIHSHFAGAPVEADADPPPRHDALAFKMG
jgi:hypothetical protein